MGKGKDKVPDCSPTTPVDERQKGKTPLSYHTRRQDRVHSPRLRQKEPYTKTV